MAKSYINKFMTNMIDRTTGKSVSVSDLADLVDGGGGGVEMPALPTQDGIYELEVDSGTVSWRRVPPQ